MVLPAGMWHAPDDTWCSWIVATDQGLFLCLNILVGHLLSRLSKLRFPCVVVIAPVWCSVWPPLSSCISDSDTLQNVKHEGYTWPFKQKCDIIKCGLCSFEATLPFSVLWTCSRLISKQGIEHLILIFCPSELCPSTMCGRGSPMCFFFFKGWTLKQTQVNNNEPQTCSSSNNHEQRGNLLFYRGYPCQQLISWDHKVVHRAGLFSALFRSCSMMTFPLLLGLLSRSPAAQLKRGATLIHL